MRELQGRGFAVATFDWRGQGLSERLLPVRERGYIPDFGVYRADLRLFTEEIARKRFAGPYVLLTHSMGGTPALQLLADGYDAFAAAVLCAPMTRLFRNPVKGALVRALAGSACSLGAARQPVLAVKEHSLQFEGNALTSDRTRHKRFRLLQEAAPDAVIREPTYGWLNAASEAMADLHRPDRFARLKTPVLIVSAERDELVDSTDHALLAARSPLIERTLIKDALHEILMEREEFRRAFWAAFDAFVAPRITSGDRSAAET